MNTTKIPLDTLAKLIAEALAKLDNVVSSDLELFSLANKKLPYYQRICYRTYKRYKAAAMAYGEMDEETQQKYDPVYNDLFNILIDVNIEQKITLHRRMMEAESRADQLNCRWALEKKFPEYNQRHQSEEFVRFNREVEQMANERFNPKEPKPAKNAQNEPTETEAPEEPFKLRIMTEGVDITDYVEQQVRRGDAEMRGEPFNEEPIPNPVPLTMPWAQQEKERQMKNEKSQIPDGEPDDRNIFGISRKDIAVYDMDALKKQFDEQQAKKQKDKNELDDSGRSNIIHNEPGTRTLPTAEQLANDPWLNPDGTIKTDEEFKAALAANRPTMFPHRAPEPTKPPQPKTPPGTMKILGIQ